ncbi:MAG: polysaccharide biosynthesis/export family protein [bacterium]
MNRFLKPILFLLTAITLCFAAFCQKDEAGRKLYAGDRIYVRIPGEPQLSDEYLIRPNGKIFLPVLEDGLDLGSVAVEGLTPSEAAERIAEVLKPYFTDTTVSVELALAGARFGAAVSVYGLVLRPSTIPYEEGMRLLDALTYVGGTSPNANLKKLTLYRGGETTSYDVNDLVQGRDFTNNFTLEEGDYIIVPSTVEQTNMKIIVLGQVAEPGSFYLPEGSHILDAIAEAGGTIGRAAVGRTFIIRVENGKPVVIHTDLKGIINRAQTPENVFLQNGDVLFIPETSRPDVMGVVDDIISLNLLKNIIKDEF